MPILGVPFMEEELKKFGNFAEKAIELLLEYGPRVLLAIATLVIGLWFIKIFMKFLDNAFRSKRLDPSLSGFFNNFFSWTLKILLLFSVASSLGFQMTSFFAILGTAGLAVGLALQGSLANLAGGVLILLLRPFKVGDYIESNSIQGDVVEIQVFCTVVLTLDNIRTIVPNGELAGNVIRNLTHEDHRRVDISVGISYSNNVEIAREALLEVGKKHKLVLNTPVPFVGVLGYGDNSIDLTFRVWCEPKHYWDVFFEVNEQVKPALDKAGISIPFPQRDLHLKSSDIGSISK